MKVHNFINKIKKTQASANEVTDWMLNNRICPIEIVENLDTKKSFDTIKLDRHAKKHCRKMQIEDKCGQECCGEFVLTEVPDC